MSQSKLPKSRSFCGIQLRQGCALTMPRVPVRVRVWGSLWQLPWGVAMVCMVFLLC